MLKMCIGDLHLGHKHLGRFRKRRSPTNPEEYMTSEEQNELAFETLARLPKRTMLFVHGDFVFTDDWLPRLRKELNCRIIYIGGNHDVNLLKFHDIPCVDRAHGLMTHKNHWMSHGPMHPQELRRRKNIHGHTHYQLMLAENGLPDPRYKCVSMEYTNFEPVSWDYVVSDEYDQECLKKWRQYKKDGFILDEAGKAEIPLG